MGIIMGKLCMELYLDNVKKRYKKASRKEESSILGEFCEDIDDKDVRIILTFTDDFMPIITVIDIS